MPRSLLTIATSIRDRLEPKPGEAPATFEQGTTASGHKFQLAHADGQLLQDLRDLAEQGADLVVALTPKRKAADA